MRWFLLCVGVWGCGGGEIVTIEPSPDLRRSPPPGQGPVITGQTNDDRETERNALPSTKPSDDLPGSGTSCLRGERQVELRALHENRNGQCLFSVGTNGAPVASLRLTFRGSEIPRDPAHHEGWDTLSPLAVLAVYGSWCNPDLLAHPGEAVLFEPCEDRHGSVK